MIWRTTWLARGAALALLFFAAALAPSLASASVGLKIQPVKVSETLNPGDSTSGSIILTNVSDRPVKVTLSVNDFVPLSGADSIQFVDRAPGVTSVKDWIKVGGGDFTFAIGESKSIPYTITAPANAEPGGHFGVVFFKAVDATSDSTLQIGTQVGMLVLVAIPGNHLQKGTILNFESPPFVGGGPVPFNIKFQNTGTVHFEPKGNIIIRNMFGGVVAQVPVEGQIVLPTSIKTLNEQWNVSGLLLGRYTASVALTDGEGDTLTSDSVSFWAFPLWYVIGFIVIVAAVFYLLRFIKRNVRVSLVR